MCNFTWILSVFTPYTCITTVGTVVRIGVAASALEKSLLTSKTTQTMQKDWATSSTKCTAADVGICNWVGMERRYFYWHIGLAKLSLCMVSIGRFHWSWRRSMTNFEDNVTHSGSGIQVACTPLWPLWSPIHCYTQFPTSHWHTPPLSLHCCCLLHPPDEHCQC